MYHRRTGWMNHPVSNIYIRETNWAVHHNDMHGPFDTFGSNLLIHSTELSGVFRTSSRRFRELETIL